MANVANIGYFLLAVVFLGTGLTAIPDADADTVTCKVGDVIISPTEEAPENEQKPVVPVSYGSESIQVNQYNLFCGNLSEDGDASAIGFSYRISEKGTPDTVNIYAQATSTHPVTTNLSYVVSKSVGRVSTGLYQLVNFGILKGQESKGKEISAMFPTQCSMQQVLNSVARAALGPDHMSMGSGDDSTNFCTDDMGVPFQISVTISASGDDKIVTLAAPDLINPYPAQ